MSPNRSKFELNHEELTKCINVAKGPHRNMAEFAKDTGISPATLSRIINGKYRKPLSLDFVERIFKNRFDQSDRALLWQLMASSGTAPNKEEALYWAKVAEHQAITEDAEKAKKAIKNALVVWLISLGKNIDCIESEFDPSSTPVNSKNVPSKFSPVKKDIWFRVYLPRKSDEDITCHQFFLCLDRSAPPLTYTYDVFLADAWTPDVFIDTKTTFAFMHNEYFMDFLEVTKTAKINSTMSAILLDSEFTVVDEKHLPFSADNLCST